MAAPPTVWLSYEEERSAATHGPRGTYHHNFYLVDNHGKKLLAATGMDGLHVRRRHKQTVAASMPHTVYTSGVDQGDAHYQYVSSAEIKARGTAHFECRNREHLKEWLQGLISESQRAVNFQVAQAHDEEHLTEILALPCPKHHPAFTGWRYVVLSHHTPFMVLQSGKVYKRRRAQGDQVVAARRPWSRAPGCGGRGEGEQRRPLCLHQVRRACRRACRACHDDVHDVGMAHHRLLCILFIAIATIASHSQEPFQSTHPLNVGSQAKVLAWIEQMLHLHSPESGAEGVTPGSSAAEAPPPELVSNNGANVS